MASFLFLLLCLITHVLANTEKTIFLGPDPVDSVPPALSTLHLDTLTPSNWSLRTQLRAEFPSSAHPSGIATWLILDHLTPGQRYEVRVCWPATQPTAFTLTTYPPSTVWSTPALLSSLLEYSASRSDQPSSLSSNNTTTTTTITTTHATNPNPQDATPNPSSTILLLQILAAADFFTTDTSLMRHPPPVDADIILDPFLANILPRSLAGTACYLVVVALVAYFGVARGVRAAIAALVRSAGEEDGLDGDGEEDEGMRKKVQ